MQARHAFTLAAGLLALGGVGRPAAAQQARAKQPEITVYKVPT